MIAITGWMFCGGVLTLLMGDALMLATDNDGLSVELMTAGISAISVAVSILVYISGAYAG